jgi:cytochrome c
MSFDFISAVSALPAFLAQLAPPAGVPVPHDLELPLPIPEWALKLWIVPLFLLHIFFVNLMVGGALMTFVNEIVGMRFPRYDRLARCIGETVTVNKSLAVVLGIGPLLMMNLLYTVHWYSANSLTGHAWVLLIPLVITVFLLAYLHKYTWETWIGPRKARHVALGGAVAAIFLFIPLIFLVQVNTMLFPDKWSQVAGFFTALQIGNVFPRYFHFIAASLALMGLFLAWWFGRASFPVEKKLPEFTRPELRRHFYRWTFWVSCAQFAFGPLVFFTLPTQGITLRVMLWIFGAALLAILVLGLLWREIQETDARIGRRFWPIAALFSLVVLGMGQGRHLYREAALAPHKEAIARKTAEFRAIELATRMRLDAGLGAGDSLSAPPSGKKLFAQTCAACHAPEVPTSAPSLTEIRQLYAGNPQGIVTWTKAPGKKRPQYGPMPSFAHLGDDNLTLIAAYILEKSAPATTPASATTPAAPGGQP